MCAIRRLPVSVMFMAALLVSAGLAAADPIPLPTVDFQAKATVYGGGTMVSRHSNGKMRVEMQIPGNAQPAVSIIDLRARKMVTTVPVPGMPNMAMEVDFSDDASFGVAIGQGRRVGSATAAGEPCELWEIESRDMDGRVHSAIACLTRDFISLRVETKIKGKRETVFEVTELKRGLQEASLFSLPANVQVMKMPKELRGLMKQ